MTKVLTVGVFDLLHLGHVLLFKRARELGDFLIVAAQRDEFITKFKPNAKVVYDINERLFMINSIKYVDKSVAYTDISKLMYEVDFDIWAKGPDQNNFACQAFEQWCIKNGKTIIVLPRTEGVSSSLLREYLKDK